MHVRELRVLCVALAVAACGPSLDSPDTDTDTDREPPEPSESPRCGDLPERVIEDQVGLTSADLASTIAHTEEELFRRVGAYGMPAAVYDGTVTARVGADDERTLETERAFATLTQPWSDTFWLVAADFDDEVTFGLQYNDGDVQADLRSGLFLHPSGFECPTLPFDLSGRPPTIALDGVPCQLDEPAMSLRFDLDLVARSPEDVDVDDLRRADQLSYFLRGEIDEFSPEGSLQVRQVSATYEESGLYVDYEATWWFCEDRIATNGVSRISITFAERCSCPPDGHCHNRYDSDCSPYRG